MNNAVQDLTISGEEIRWYSMPDGSLHSLYDTSNNIFYRTAWKYFKKPVKLKINTFQIVKF